MDFVQIVNRLIQIIPTIFCLQVIGHLPFPGFFNHQAVEKTGKEKLPDNRLNSAASHPQFTYRLLRDLKNRAGGHFRLKDRRYGAHGPGKFISGPLELRRVETWHLHHRQRDPTVFMHQLGTHGIGEAPNCRFCATVGRLQRNGTVGQRRADLNNRAAIAGDH